MLEQGAQVPEVRFERIRRGIGYILGLLLFLFIVLADVPEAFVDLVKDRL